MLKRVVSLLLLPCVLLTQSAAMLGHSHGSGQPPGHDLRPHIHTNPSPHHEHGHHHHGPDGHHHHHDGDHDPEPGTHPTSQPEPVSDHDSDAVFITSVDVVINDRVLMDDESPASPQWVAAGLNQSTAFSADPARRMAHWTHPPPPSNCVCPLYIRHLALLF